MLPKPLPQNMSHDKRLSMQSWRESILTKVRNRINENFHPPKRDIEGSCSVTEIPLGLGISEKDYHSTLSLSKDNDYGLHLT